MNNFIKKTILTTVTLGLLLSTVFGPLFSSKAYADAAYLLSGTSATESTINFQVIVQAGDPSDLQGVNPLEIEYSTNQDYSASQTVAVPDFDTVQLTQNRIVTAGGLTPSTTYYARLLNSSSVSLYEVTAQTSAPGTTTQDPTSGTPGETSTLPPCVLLSAETWGGCVARIIYFLFFVPTSFLFSLSGQLMDFSMAYTLNSANYGKTADGSSFVEKGWTITRDLSNLLFIVMLMWIAINIILGRGADKKLLGTIILIGLVINFSLFFARVIIDASNILGKIFYDNMGVETNSEAYINNPWIGEGDKSISIAIVSNFNPQKLFSQAGTLKLNTASGVQDTGSPDAGPFIIITLIMSVINLFGMYIFFVVAFILIGRVIGLWLLMIFAPIAFISYIMPSSASGMLDKMHHSKWWPELFKQSFVVPIFLFLLYLILLFVNTGFLKGFKTFDNTTTGGILDVIVPLIIITFLLKQAKDIATNMSGDIGKAFASVGSTVGGLALGGALGGYAKLGRATVGKLGQRVAESETMMNLQRRGGLTGWAAEQVRTGAKATGSASFDARGVSGVTGVMKSAGMSNFGESAKGGYKGYKERQAKSQKETADELIKGSINDRTNQDVRRARRNLDVLMQTHGPEITSREEALEKARKDFKEAKDDGYKENDPPDGNEDGLNKWQRAKNAIAKAAEDVKNYSEQNGIKDAKTQLRNSETARKREEEARKRGQSQEIEATNPKNKAQMEKTLAKKKELEDTLKTKKGTLESMKEVANSLDSDSDSYAQAQKQISDLEEEVKDTQSKINKISYSKKNIFSRIGRRISSGGEYGQTGAYETADNQRKGLKDEKKGDDKK